MKTVKTIEAPQHKIEDDDRVRIGNQMPMFPAAGVTPNNAADNGKVRIGNQTPSFRLRG